MTPDFERTHERSREQRRALARKVARVGVRAFFHALTNDANAQHVSEGYSAALAGSNPKVVVDGAEHALS